MRWRAQHAIAIPVRSVPLSITVVWFCGSPGCGADCVIEYKMYADMAHRAAEEAIAYDREGNEDLTKTSASVEGHFSNMADIYSSCGLENSGAAVKVISLSDMLASRIGAIKSFDSVHDLRVLHDDSLSQTRLP